MKWDRIDLNDIPVFLISFDEEQIDPVREEIGKIQNSFETQEPFNGELAGNLEKEFQLFESVELLDNLIRPFVNHESVIEFNNANMTYFDNSVVADLVLGNTWVNFMRKHEFNPLHIHSGLWSFVIWVEVPYDIKEEFATPMSKGSLSPLSGCFGFYYPDSMGGVKYEMLPVDKKYRNKAVVFPASLSHIVYPFSTSDDYRISVSGNYAFKIRNQM